MRCLLKGDGRIGVATWQRSPFGLFREVVARMGYSAPGVQSASFGRDASELVSTLRDIGFKEIDLETLQESGCDRKGDGNWGPCSGAWACFGGYAGQLLKENVPPLSLYLIVPEITVPALPSRQAVVPSMAP